MNGIFLFFLAVLAVASLVQSQQGQQQQVALTREIVDGLLQVLTPNCRGELEAAIESQQGTDLSDECKYEIQMNLQEMGQGVAGASTLDGYEDEEEPARASSASTPPPKNIINPVVGIVLFFVALFGAIGFAVVYINGQVGDFKPKKISKKKEEKLRAKGAR